MTASTTPKENETNTIKETAIQLRMSGATYIEIREATGLTERQVKDIVRGTPKPKRSRSVNSRVDLPFAKSFERVFPLAIRPQGIRDYELKIILHEEYGTTWDTSTGCYRSKFDSDTIARVKAKVRKRALDEDCNVIFAMDWIDENNPRSSSEFLVNAATDLLSRIDEYVHEYMASHGTRQTDKSEASELARKKQHYAVQQHLLKLAITGYGKEPVEKLLNRTADLIGMLEGNPDLCPAECSGSDQEKVNKPEYIPEPYGIGHFLDYAVQQGWII
ncbi:MULTISPECIES: hypothetical protein [unclassified Pseudomonas]|uniref:hypothetical protein n=1 Tax=unclassified Pseudomonas TaxID=196821 RepID=UPI00117A13FA|nr:MULTISPECIES: hypothetical protein [unclassified Pseudomonas]